MVLIYNDLSSEESVTIRKELLKNLIPVAIGTSEDMVRFALVVVLPLGSSDDLALVADKEKVIYADYKSISNDKSYSFEIHRIISRIEDVFFIKNGFDPYTVSGGAFYDSIDYTSYFGTVCHLTDVERLIVRFLVICGSNRAPSQVVASYCLDSIVDPKAVAVHISKINNKLSLYSNLKAINSKRNLGYRLTLI